ncbi:MAG: hypothetical protein GF372_02630 [Candidatus Marinimicrobia bacterium]|nr:hypothetical protein [Candidatus Neomarinimicrobiota bacterium]
MNVFRTIALQLFAVFFIAGMAHADSPWSAGFGLVVGSPQDEFRQNVDNAGFGLDAFVTHNFGGSAFQFGGSFSFMVYGREERSEPFSYSIPDVRVDVITTNSIVMGHLLARLQPPTGGLRPYVEGLYGFHYLSTSTTIENQHANEDDNEIASSTNFEDFTSSYGGGAGLMFTIWDASKTMGGDSDFSGRLLLDLGARYLFGGEAEYLKKGSIQPNEETTDPTDLVYDVQQSETDILNFRIGLVFDF